MKSRLLVTERERAQLWDVVAKLRRTNGDKEGADMAAWQARSIRSAFPVRRPGK